MSKPKVDLPNNLTQDLADNLAHLLREANLSENDLAKAVGLPYNTVHRLILRTTSDPRMSTLKPIAEFFNVSIDALTGSKQFPLGSAGRITSPRSVPLLGWEILRDKKFLSNINRQTWHDWEAIAYAKQENLSADAFALESSKSMQPRFPEGSVFIVDPNVEAMDGDLILVRFKETGDISLRELAVDSPHWQLMPIVQGSSSLAYDKKAHDVIGIVVLTMIHTHNTV